MILNPVLSYIKEMAKDFFVNKENKKGPIDNPKESTP